MKAIHSISLYEKMYFKADHQSGEVKKTSIFA